ncbi:MAG: 2-dehydropantoate 2-reductase N-terminal domain-containing protein [Candidatus Eisenbacteria bacterium]|nr:2-dehydropantoate 2-reductase N-terminal domain-containing protein [Candidatus Eisenbacteria bacterium]
MPSDTGQSTPPHYVIHGAGAVGGSMGAILARSGRRVTLVARPAVVTAIRAQRGLSLVCAGTATLVPLEAVTRIDEITPGPNIRLLLTMKAGDLQSALPLASAALGAGTPTVTWQNGIRAEASAHSWFPDLLGGIVRATSTMLTPGEVRIRTPGILILGRWPHGRAADDPFLDAVIADLINAGFDAVASPDIVADKGLKLVVNLFSGVSPLVRADGSAMPAAARLERNVIIEGARILKAAGIAFHPAGGRGDDVTAMLAHLAGRAARHGTFDGVHNSTWQNLHHPGRRLENEYMNGEIITLAARLGRAAPWNQCLLDLLTEAHERALGPNALGDDELAVRLVGLTDPLPWRADEDDISALADDISAS